MRIKHLPIYRKLVYLVNKYFPVLMAKLRFRMLFGRNLNLKNPQDLNEKILYLSLYTDTSEWTRLADKYKVREYVFKKGCGENLVKLYGVWNNANEINWDDLPNKFVIKTNNGCATNLLVYDKDKLDIIKTTKLLQTWLDTKVSVSTTEFHYQKIEPLLIAEELLIPCDDDKKISSSLIDYKIWCFNGKADCILVCSDRTTEKCDLTLYDCNWNIINKGLKKDSNIILPKPKNFSKMIEIAEKLSEGFPQVRVDLYNINGNIYFGEMTFTSHGGTMVNYMQSQLMKMGGKVDINLAKRIK